MKPLVLTLFWSFVLLSSSLAAKQTNVNTGDAATKMQLFDLQNDPGEQQDVVAQHPEEVKRLLAAYEAMSKDVPVIEEVKRTPYKK